MVSPYLLKPLRSVNEVEEGRRRRAARIAAISVRALVEKGPGVEFWDSRPPSGPRLVWTNAAKARRREA